MEREYWYVSAAGVLSGLLVFGARVFSEMGLSLYEISIFFALFESIAVLPFILFRKEYGLKRGMLRQFVLFGFVGLLLNFSDFGAVILGAPVALAILLIYTQPLWTTIFGRAFLKEAITKNHIIAIAMVLLGVTVLVNPFTVGRIGSMAGVILAMFGGIFLSLWVILGRHSGRLKHSPFATQFGYSSFRLLFTLMSFPLILFFVQDPSITNVSLGLPAEMWIYLFMYAMAAGVIPHIFYFAGVRKVPASTAGIILLLEPVSAALLAAAFLLQPITLNILAGGALILLSNYLVVRKS
jgi:drug/metabolite transporter (DMT)-like permease